MSEWNEARVERLKTLWADGWSCSQIAADMGNLTRNAVIGKVHRLKLPERRPRTRSSIAPAKRKAKRRAKAISRVKVTQMFAPAIMPDPVPVPDDPRAAGDVARLSLLELGAHTCRWPVGDPKLPGFGFCGAPSGIDGPYCPEHMARACTPRPEPAAATYHHQERARAA